MLVGAGHTPWVLGGERDERVHDSAFEEWSVYPFQKLKSFTFKRIRIGYFDLRVRMVLTPPMWQIPFTSCLNPLTPFSGRGLSCFIIGEEHEEGRDCGLCRSVQLVISELQFAQRELLALNPLVCHHFQHLLSIITNPGSLQTMLAAPARPRRFWLSWSGE